VRFEIQPRCVEYEVEETRLREEAESVLEDAAVPMLSEAVTWYTTALGVTDDDDVADDVRDALKEQMEIFADAFNQANAEMAEGN
ncbi:MAG: hypothetical protein HKN73_15470, partial [Gemmatimonadetes bacterium]|nr:hypothetical protein [Gemmatimonadota bacterium]